MTNICYGVIRRMQCLEERSRKKERRQIIERNKIHKKVLFPKSNDAL